MCLSIIPFHFSPRGTPIRFFFSIHKIVPTLKRCCLSGCTYYTNETKDPTKRKDFGSTNNHSTPNKSKLVTHKRFEGSITFSLFQTNKLLAVPKRNNKSRSTFSKIFSPKKREKKKEETKSKTTKTWKIFDKKLLFISIFFLDQKK